MYVLYSGAEKGFWCAKSNKLLWVSDPLDATEFSEFSTTSFPLSQTERFVTLDEAQIIAIMEL